MKYQMTTRDRAIRSLDTVAAKITALEGGTVFTAREDALAACRAMHHALTDVLALVAEVQDAGETENG